MFVREMVHQKLQRDGLGGPLIMFLIGEPLLDVTCWGKVPELWQQPSSKFYGI